MEKKLFKYYAIRVMNTVVFRRTVNQIQKVKSVIYKPNSDFRLEQVTYIGGTAVGSMSYNDWAKHGGSRLSINACIRVSREQFRALDPYINKER
jgi:hypothetical protein